MGGNCELSECNKTVVKEDVIIIGESNIPATVPVHATEMYAKNIFNFVSCMIKDKKLNLDMEDEVIAKSLVVKDGKVIFEPVKELIGGEKKEKGGKKE